jgi:hypothetical protein
MTKGSEFISIGDRHIVKCVILGLKSVPITAFGRFHHFDSPESQINLFQPIPALKFGSTVFILNVSKKHLNSFTPVPSRQNDGRPRRRDSEQPCLRDDVVRYLYFGTGNW